MSEKGDKICPLCTEEMDLTDQQLKPCKCGYEICVWCWNHIMEMAEKDNTEGRCPACRMPYDKEKIVGMAAECERLVAEMSSERKLKSQKMKPKVSEGRMHLINVRVIQRNLVYIIGLPLNLADETLLQKKDCFGQYGKVLKVSISRAATGAIQHASNNSCCVYVTYSKEKEAICCIQSVHSFVLEGRPLRACFGTTKYCHTWLKNMSCTIADCLYLHDFGSPEDSFTKDDLVSAFTRSRVQQIIGATNNLNRRSGNVLPPPADDCTNRNISMAKPNSENSNSSGNCESGYCADSGTGRSNVLPGAASWVARASVSLPSVGSMSGSGVTPNNQPEESNGSQVPLAEALCHKRYVEGPTKSTVSGEVCPPFITSDHSSRPSVSESQNIPPVPSSGASSLKFSKPSCVPSLHEELFHNGEDILGLCSELSSVSIDNNLKDQSLEHLVSENLIYNHKLLGGQGTQQDVSDLFSEPSTSTSSRESTIVDDLLGIGDQQPPTISYLPSSEKNLKEPTNHSWQHDVSLQNTTDVHANVSRMKYAREAFMPTSSKPAWSNRVYTNHSNGFAELDGNSNYSDASLIAGPEKRLKEHSNVANFGAELALDAGENSIISNILSMDFEAWEDFSLTSLQSLVKLQDETGKQHNSLKMPSLRKAKESNQSRFSFAWQDDLQTQESTVECSFENQPDKLGVPDHFLENHNTHVDKYSYVSSNTGAAKFNGFLGNNPSVSKSPTSPPGFSVTSKPLPPGFPTHGAVHHPFDKSDHLPQNSVSQSRIPSSSKNVEFIDPAIVEVSKGNLTTKLINPGFDLRPALPSELNPLDHDTEFQMLMRQSISTPQNQNFFPYHLRNMFFSPTDSYSISPRLLGQSPPNNPSLLSERQEAGNLNVPNGHWGGWNEVKSPNYLNGQMGFGKFMPNYDDMKYQISSSSSNLYGRGFAM